MNQYNLIFYFKKFLKLAVNPERSIRNKMRTVINLYVKYRKKIKHCKISFSSSSEKEEFSGWGLKSNHLPPWKYGVRSDETSSEFLHFNNRLLKNIESKKFILSQFQIDNNYSEPPKNKLTYLSWRHFIVYWSAKYSSKQTKSKKINIVEAGVCDGLTAYFAISAINSQVLEGDLKVFLYDAWAAMKLELLTDQEMNMQGEYAYLSLRQTKLNLEEFNKNCNYLQGDIPEVFREHPGPDEISWLHIDLNSSIPTEKTLQHFASKVLPGGIILFDDYGWKGAEDTKEVADQFCSQIGGLLLPLPTGQAIFFKH